MTDFTSMLNIQHEVLDFLLSSPTPEEIIAFHASEAAQHRLSDLLEANRNGTLTDAERAELDETEHLNHFFMRLKAKAHLSTRS